MNWTMQEKALARVREQCDYNNISSQMAFERMLELSQLAACLLNDTFTLEEV